MTMSAPDWVRSKAIKAPTLQALTERALADLVSMGGDVALVCGPISSGGLGDVDMNLDVFNATIASLRRHDPAIFDTLPFEAGIIALKNDFEANPPTRARRSSCR